MLVNFENVGRDRASWQAEIAAPLLDRKLKSAILKKVRLPARSLEVYYFRATGTGMIYLGGRTIGTFSIAGSPLQFVTVAECERMTAEAQLRVDEGNAGRPSLGRLAEQKFNLITRRAGLKGGPNGLQLWRNVHGLHVALILESAEGDADEADPVGNGRTLADLRVGFTNTWSEE